MTDKQKEAVALLGRLIREKKINDEEYRLLMETVLENRFVYFPTYPTYPSITPDKVVVESEPNKVNLTTTIGDSYNPTSVTEKDYSEFAQHTSTEDLYPHKEFQG